MDFNEYRDNSAVSRSDLVNVAQSFEHYEERRENQGKDTPAMKFGRAFHCAVLEPEKFKTDYVLCPKIDRRTKKGKEEWAEFQTLAQGKELLGDLEMLTIDRMMNALKCHTMAWDLIEMAEKEVSIFWKNAKGVDCKARLDGVYHSIVFDLKTCVSAAPQDFRKSISNHFYDLQAAFYLEAARSKYGSVIENFIFVCVEKTAPYSVRLYRINEPTLEAGQEIQQKLMSRLIDGKETPRKFEIEDISLPAFGFDIDARIS